MSPRLARRAAAGVIAFTALSFLGSWFVAAALRALDLSANGNSLGTHMLSASLLYAAAMGWQPIVAIWFVRRWIDVPTEIDLGLRPSRSRYTAIGCGGAVLLAAGAALLAYLAMQLGLGAPRPLGPALEPPIVGSARDAAALAGSLAGTLLLVWLQAFAEEIGWRGYFLPRVIERFGKWRGLALHGVVWGVWYAPVLFFATYGTLAPAGSAARSLNFLVTCALLGMVLGWLRLAANSLAPAVLANTTLTLVAGLPYVIHGADPGLRSAAFGPAGWLVLVVAIAAIALSRWQLAPALPPSRSLAHGELIAKVWSVFERGEDRDDSRSN